MKHYLSPTGALFGYESDGSQDHLIPPDYRLATDAELYAFQHPALTVPQQLAQLDASNTLTQRNLREFILLTAKAVQTLNPALDLTQLPGIAKVVQVEVQAAALRSQL